MDWTTHQVTEMRTGRPTYRNTRDGTALTWLRTGEETAGEYSLLYGEYETGIKVFPHYHTLYTETVHMFEGKLAGRIGGQDVQAGPDEELHVPMRAVHQWESVGDRTLRFLLEIRPAHPGFEKWVVALQNMANDGLTHPDGRPKNLQHTALILEESDIHLVGRAKAMNPVLRLVARRARRAGIDHRLEDSYYRPT